MKIYKELLLVSLIMMMIFSIVSCKFGNVKEHLKVSGDFKYYSYKLNDIDWVWILEMSDEGIEKESIILPNEIDNKKINEGFGGRIKNGYFDFVVTGIKRLYIPSYLYHKINRLDLSYYSEDNPISIFCPKYNSYVSSSIKKENNNSIIKYTSATEYYELMNKNSEQVEKDGIIPANVSYYLEDDYSKNYVYFIDDCDGTTVNIVPPNPIKEGYRFDGWYKDKDYTQKWNFETDIVPPKQYDEDGNYIYQETSIYAKFTYIGE